MTESELTTAIALAVPKDRANADVIAKSMLALAISKVGRMSGVSFNRDLLTFNFVVGDNSYKLGIDILQKYPLIWNMQELWFTDQQGYKVRLVGLDEYNNSARGGTSTGRPTIGTLHSSTATLEVYPIPDSAYTMCAYVRRQVNQLSDIPAAYHDLLYAKAVELITVTTNPEMAIKMAAESTLEIKQDALTEWDGTLVESDRPILGTSMNEERQVRSTSYDLLGGRR